jgi:hypothetical protein
MSNPEIEHVAMSNPNFALKVAKKLNTTRVLIGLFLFTIILVSLEKTFIHNEYVIAAIDWIYTLSVAFSASCIVLISVIVTAKFVILDHNIDRLTDAITKLPANFEEGTKTFLLSSGRDLIKNSLFRNALQSLRLPADSQVDQLRLMIKFSDKLGKMPPHLFPAITYLLEPSFEEIEKNIANLSSLNEKYHMNAGDQIRLSKSYLDSIMHSVEFLDYEISDKLSKSWSVPFTNYVKSVGLKDGLVRTQSIICEGSSADFDIDIRVNLKAQIEFMKSNNFSVKLIFRDDLGKLNPDVFKWRAEIFDNHSLFRVERKENYLPNQDINVAVSGLAGDPDFSKFLTEIRAHGICP